MCVYMHRKKISVPVAAIGYAANREDFCVSFITFPLAYMDFKKITRCGLRPILKDVVCVTSGNTLKQKPALESKSHLTKHSDSSNQESEMQMI